MSKDKGSEPMKWTWNSKGRPSRHSEDYIEVGPGAGKKGGKGSSSSKGGKR